jgi:hypothetical protein
LNGDLLKALEEAKPPQQEERAESSSIVGLQKQESLVELVAEPSQRPADSEAKRKRLRELFDQIDVDGSGHINKRELIKALRNTPGVAEFLGLPQAIRQEDGTRTAFERFFQGCDSNDDREISWEELQRAYELSMAQDREDLNSLDALVDIEDVGDKDGLAAGPWKRLGSGEPEYSQDELEVRELRGKAQDFLKRANSDGSLATALGLPEVQGLQVKAVEFLDEVAKSGLLAKTLEEDETAVLREEAQEEEVDDPEEIAFLQQQVRETLHEGVRSGELLKALGTAKKDDTQKSSIDDLREILGVSDLSGELSEAEAVQDNQDTAPGIAFQLKPEEGQDDDASIEDLRSLGRSTLARALDSGTLDTALAKAQDVRSQQPDSSSPAAAPRSSAREAGQEQPAAPIASPSVPPGEVQKARKELVSLKAMASDNAKLMAEVQTMQVLVEQANLHNSMMREKAKVPDLKLGEISDRSRCCLPEIGAHRFQPSAGGTNRSSGASMPSKRSNMPLQQSPAAKVASLPSLR